MCGRIDHVLVFVADASYEREEKRKLNENGYFHLTNLYKLLVNNHRCTHKCGVFMTDPSWTIHSCVPLYPTS